MTDLRELFERQAAWQKRRAVLTWPEKVRRAEGVREWAARVSRARRMTRSRPVEVDVTSDQRS